MSSLISALNPQQWKAIGAMLLGTTGPIAWLLSRYFGLADSDIKMWLDFVAAVTPLVAGAFITASKSDTGLAKDAASLPGVQVHVDPYAAPPNVVDVAKDPGVRDVVPMIGGPRADTNKSA